MIAEVPDNQGGSYRQIASAFKFSKSKAEYKFAGVPAGSHTDEILKEVGLGQADIERYREDNTIA